MNRLPLIALILLLFAWSGQSQTSGHQEVLTNGAFTFADYGGQVACPPPVLYIVDPVTGKQVTHIDFGTVLIGQVKTVQVKILNPPASPCNLTFTTASNGEIHIEGRPR